MSGDPVKTEMDGAKVLESAMNSMTSLTGAVQRYHTEPPGPPNAGAPASQAWVVARSVVPSSVPERPEIGSASASSSLSGGMVQRMATRPSAAATASTAI